VLERLNEVVTSEASMRDRLFQLAEPTVANGIPLCARRTVRILVASFSLAKFVIGKRLNAAQRNHH
jgi:hypothetical protein